jgi:hypothetical protein
VWLRLSPSRSAVPVDPATSTKSSLREPGKRFCLMRALFVPDVERIECVDAPNLQPGVSGSCAHPSRGFDVLQAVAADIVTQLDRDRAEFHRGADKFVGRQRRRNHMIEAKFNGALRHVHFLEISCAGDSSG